MRNAKPAGAAGSSNLRTVSDDELGGVAGGMKWTRGTTNSDVVDARGGQLSILCFNVTLDVNGKVSSVTLK